MPIHVDMSLHHQGQDPRKEEAKRRSQNDLFLSKQKGGGKPVRDVTPG